MSGLKAERIDHTFLTQTPIRQQLMAHRTTCHLYNIRIILRCSCKAAVSIMNRTHRWSYPRKPHHRAQSTAVRSDCLRYRIHWAPQRTQKISRVTRDSGRHRSRKIQAQIIGCQSSLSSPSWGKHHPFSQWMPHLWTTIHHLLRLIQREPMKPTEYSWERYPNYEEVRQTVSHHFPCKPTRCYLT